MADGVKDAIDGQTRRIEEYAAALADLDAKKGDWARQTPAERMALLSAVKDGVMQVAEDWVDISARTKGLTPGSAVAGEEWLLGPYAVMAGVNSLLFTLSQIEDKRFVDHLPLRQLPSGHLGVKVLPHSLWERLLLSGVSAEVWMKKSVSSADLKKHVAIAYDVPAKDRVGKVALVLGAGNVAAITLLDVLHKLVVENQVVILKMNPVNDYLTVHYEIAMKPFIEAGYLRIVKGDAADGSYLCMHPLVEELHITGSDATHDAIVWGVGEAGAANKTAGRLKNSKRFTSELGSVSPTIVVPGPWSVADVQFQAENIATMKLHNSGHNCIAMQALIMPKGWDKGSSLMDAVRGVIASSTRPAWYPGSDARLDRFAKHGGRINFMSRVKNSPPVVIGEITDDSYNQTNEVFGPAFSLIELDGSDAERFLIEAIEFVNTRLWGTLGANILIHPQTVQQIGENRFEEMLAELRYGTIGINSWCGLGFLLPTCPWGAYPGHTLADIGSGIGTVHNAFMLEDTEKVVIRAPWRPFPRNVFSGQFALFPRPPFFITNKRQHKIAEAMTRFQYRPSWSKLPKIFYHALLG